MRTFDGLPALRNAVGEHLGHSGWLWVDQDRVDTFAAATGDSQWIHVDPTEAAKGPYGGTIVHGYLTLALVPALVHQVYVVEGVAMAVNYGSNRVRFPAPLPAGARVRAGVTLNSVTKKRSGWHVVCDVVLESDAVDKPVCVAQTVSVLSEGSRS